MLMKDGVICHQALTATRVMEDDLIGMLREANALDLSHVRAVILETTCDISVLHSRNIDNKLLQV